MKRAHDANATTLDLHDVSSDVAPDLAETALADGSFELELVVEVGTGPLELGVWFTELALRACSTADVAGRAGLAAAEEDVVVTVPELEEAGRSARAGLDGDGDGDRDDDDDDGDDDDDPPVIFVIVNAGLVFPESPYTFGARGKKKLL